MKVGVALRVRYDAMVEVTRVAEECGYESVWLPEHLIWPAEIGPNSPHADSTHPPVDPTIPTLDTLMYLVRLAEATSTIRLGTYVYNLALRHPFVAARAVQTLDVLSGGRVEFGIGAGWSPGEWAATGLDFATRGRRLDECIDVVRLLWSQSLPEYTGEFFAFDSVVFEPKPVQGLVPILVGGESPAAFQRAARYGDGWLGMYHSPTSAAAAVAKLRLLCDQARRDWLTFTVCCGGDPTDAAGLQAYADAGVDRLIVSPWNRTADAVDGLRDFAQRALTAGGGT